MKHFALLYPATFLKVSLLCGCFLHFLNCANGTKSHRASHNILLVPLQVVTCDLFGLAFEPIQALPKFQY